MYRSDFLIAAGYYTRRLSRARLLVKILRQEGILAENSSVVVSLAEILLESYGSSDGSNFNYHLLSNS
ncbi:MAG: hypothetical protein ACUVUU_02530 [bacterium]